jgi:hypothetical protein
MIDYERRSHAAKHQKAAAIEQAALPGKSTLSESIDGVHSGWDDDAGGLP